MKRLLVFVFALALLGSCGPELSKDKEPIKFDYPESTLNGASNKIKIPDKSSIENLAEDNNQNSNHSIWDEWNNPLYKYGFKSEIPNAKKWLSWNPTKKTLSKISDETKEKILNDKLQSNRTKDAIKNQGQDITEGAQYFYIKPFKIDKEGLIKKLKKGKKFPLVFITKETIYSPISLNEYLDLSVSYMDKYKNSLTYRIDNSGYVNKGIIEWISFTSIKFKTVIIEGKSEMIIIQFAESLETENSEKNEFNNFVSSIKPLFNGAKAKKNDTQIISSDGYSFGSKDDFINGCLKKFSKVGNDSLKFNRNDFCSCVAGVANRINKDDFYRLILKSDFSVLLNDSVYNYFMNCSENAFDLANSIGTFPSKLNSNTTEILVKQCLYELSDIKNIPNKNKIKFCNCKVEKAIESNLRYYKFSELLSEDREAYNKIIFPCTGLLNDIKNYYNKDDIIGKLTKTQVPILSNGSSFKLELEIEGLSRYFVFDTGADEIIISAELEAELLEKKLINSNSYLGTEELELADGSIIIARSIVLNNIKIGEYKINNVITYVTKDGGMLCGMGFLNKFKKWEVDKSLKKLIIYK